MPKITNYSASEIARRVANKALEHEYAPLKEQADAAALQLHRIFFEEYLPIPITKNLVAHGVLERNSAMCIKVGNTEWTICSVDYANPQFYTRTLNLSEDEHIAIFNHHMLPAYTSQKKIKALACSIHQQIQGRTVAFVCKQWPEVAPFITDVMGTEAVGLSEMTVPFEDLLKQFLALPAPTNI